ncbi:septum formation family protein [Arthrobacter sp. ov407]|uniref:septum formation family protein n=1 Tax=Arthrobacter sp. ov407 TaxID=1761748 RepID=UPI001C40934F|nr:septum formation family protein [Arthrobacter sp. ov407]
MTEENPRYDAGFIPPPPSRPPTSALPVITADPPRATNRPAAPAAARPSGLTFAGIVAALSQRARPLARRARTLGHRGRPLVRRIRRQGPKRLGVAAAVLVALGLLVWWAVAAFAGGGQPPAESGSQAPAASSASAPASRGALPLEGVSPMDFQLADCFKDFDPNAQQSTIVDCSTVHSAQLVAVEKYGADESYPGREPLKQKARNACKTAPLTDKAHDYDLSYKLAYPSSHSWDKGDRRVDCYAVTDAGNVIKESLLP